jgi:uncharacterized membrane protein YjjP (DUF1212 family)
MDILAGYGSESDEEQREFEAAAKAGTYSANIVDASKMSITNTTTMTTIQDVPLTVTRRSRLALVNQDKDFSNPSFVKKHIKLFAIKEHGTNLKEV